MNEEMTTQDLDKEKLEKAIEKTEEKRFHPSPCFNQIKQDLLPENDSIRCLSCPNALWYLIAEQKLIYYCMVMK